MSTDTHQMDMNVMHNMCQKELKLLEKNMERFLQNSENIKKLLNKNNSSAATNGVTSGSGGCGGVNNMFAFIAFDRYMSQISTVINMARKFNIHLQLNRLPENVLNNMEPLEATFGGCGVGSPSKSSLFQELMQWSSTWMGHEFDEQSSKNDSLLTLNGYDMTNMDDKITQRKAIESPERVLKNPVRKSSVKLNFDVSNLDEYLQTIVPTKNISCFTNGHTFSASITHVKDTEKLIFYVCEMKDYHTLFEISSPKALKPMQHLAFIDKLFYISQHKRETGNDKMCVWRAILVPEEFCVDQSALLIDFGEIIHITEECELFGISPKFAETPPLAIKCVLKGVYDSDGLLSTEQSKCQAALVSKEFQMANFRVLGQESRVLQVILLDAKAEETCKLPSTVKKHSKGNPFLDAILLEEEAESDEKSDLMPMPISAVYSNSTKSQLKPHRIIKITVTHVISPVNFYAVIEDTMRIGMCEVFFWSDGEISEAQKQITALKQNDIVLAQYIKDDHWYRARIVDIMPEGNLYKVFYIDFGNTETVPVSCLASCNSQQSKSPPQAVLFRIDGIELVYPRDNSDAEDVRNRLQKATEAVVVIILNQTIHVEVVHHRSNNEEIVIRFTDDQYSYIPSMILNMGVVNEV